MTTGLSALGVRGTSAAIVAAGLLATSASASFIVIDDFSMVGDPNPWPVQVAAPGVAMVAEDVPNVIGGHRHSTITATNLLIPGLDFIQVSVFTGAGVLDYVSSAGAMGLLHIHYDGDGAMNVDLSAQMGIQIDFALFDFANDQPMPVTVHVSDGSNMAHWTITLTSAGAQSLFFSFNDFNNIGAVNLSDIVNLGVMFDAGEAIDFRVAQIITVVPNPGSLALLGVAGFVLRSRRRS